ncbi:hypothetical protein V8E53_002660 [Lactarius tabidus]
MPPKADINKAGWEQSESPILCETCLGDNPFIRMNSDANAGPMHVPSPSSARTPAPACVSKRHSCQTCAKTRNVCQTCLLDLKYHLPMQVRDTALGVANEAPRGGYCARKQETKFAGSENKLNDGRAFSASSEMLKQLARTKPYYKHNRPHVCSFYVKGECNRGMEHDLQLSKQNIRDRYFGHYSPVACNIWAGHAEQHRLKPPEDESVRLFQSSLPASATEGTVRTSVIKTRPGIDPTSLRSGVHVTKSVFYPRFDETWGTEIAYQVPEGLITSCGGPISSGAASPVPSGSLHASAFFPESSESLIKVSPQKSTLSSTFRTLFNFEDVSKEIIAQSPLCG